SEQTLRCFAVGVFLSLQEMHDPAGTLLQLASGGAVATDLDILSEQVGTIRGFILEAIAISKRIDDVLKGLRPAAVVASSGGMTIPGTSGAAIPSTAVTMRDYVLVTTELLQVVTA